MTSNKQSTFMQDALKLNRSLMLGHLTGVALDDAILTLKRLLDLCDQRKRSVLLQNSKDVQKLESIIMTNLACLYRKKSKPSVALFYLKAVQNMQNQLGKSDEDSGSTHSNLCAVYSEMGRHEEALREIKLGILALQRATVANPTNKLNGVNLLVGYLNCALEYEHLKKYDKAKRTAQKGLEEAERLQFTSDVEIVIQISETLKRVEEKLRKLDQKFANFYQNQYRHKMYFKNRSILDQTFVVHRDAQNGVQIQTKMPSTVRISQFPNLFTRNSRTKSSKSTIDIVSLYKSKRSTSQDYYLNLPNFRSHNTSKVSLNNTQVALQRTIQSSLLQYAEKKKEKRVFRLKKFQ